LHARRGVKPGQLPVAKDSMGTASQHVTSTDAAAAEGQAGSGMTGRTGPAGMRPQSAQQHKRIHEDTDASAGIPAWGGKRLRSGAASRDGRQGGQPTGQVPASDGQVRRAGSGPTGGTRDPRMPPAAPAARPPLPASKAGQVPKGLGQAGARQQPAPQPPGTQPAVGLYTAAVVAEALRRLAQQQARAAQSVRQ
jgi:hypothetical protein